MMVLAMPARWSYAFPAAIEPMNQQKSDMIERFPVWLKAALGAALLIGEHLVIVRHHGDRWFLGALTDRNPRDLPVQLDFLGAGSWKLRLWKDAPDSDTVGEHLVTEQRTVTAADALTLHLARAGGAVACFEPLSRQ